jgi:hypothetical protein
VTVGGGPLSEEMMGGCVHAADGCDLDASDIHDLDATSINGHVGAGFLFLLLAAENGCREGGSRALGYVLASGRSGISLRRWHFL